MGKVQHGLTDQMELGDQLEIVGERRQHGIENVERKHWRTPMQQKAKRDRLQAATGSSLIEGVGD